MKYPARTPSILITALLLITHAACDSDKSQVPVQEVLRPVKAITIDTRNNLSGREFSGVVDADRKVDLAFRVSGELASMPVREGDQVEQGQEIARLDRADFEIKLQGVQANYDRARAEYDRGKSLLERKMIAQADYDVLKAQYETADAELAGATRELGYTSLNAPFSGNVVARHVENYAKISAGAPVITLMDLDSLVIRIDVPESIMILVQPEGKRPDMVAVFDALGDHEFPLTLKEVSTQADNTTQTYQVTLAMGTHTGYNILPGMSATVRVLNPRLINDAGLVYLPPHAVLEDDGGRFVYIVEDQRDGTAVARRRTVTTGALAGAGLQIRDGLADGDRVITGGMTRITDGMRVRSTAEDGR